MKLHLKVRSDAADAEQRAVREAALSAGAAEVRPLFPESPDQDLATLYTVDVDTEAALRRVMKELTRHHAVEFVEREVKRKLKSP